MFIMYKNQMFYGIPEEGTKASKKKWGWSPQGHRTTRVHNPKLGGPQKVVQISI